MTYHYIHRLVSSLNSDQRNLPWMTINSDSQLVKVQAIIDCRLFILKCGIYITPLLQRFKEHCRRGGGKTVRARGHDNTMTKLFSQHKAVIHMNPQELWQHEQLFHKLKPDKYPNFGGGKGTQELPPLAEELLANDSCYEKERQFSLRVWPCVGWAWSRRWTQTQVVFGEYNLDLMGFKKREGGYEVGKGRGGRGGSERRWGRSWVWSKHIVNNSQRINKNILF